MAAPMIPHGVFILLECALLAVACGAALWRHGFTSPLLSRWESAFRQLAERRTLAVVVSGLLPVILRLALIPVLEVPAPAIQEEFSYLLMADTFAAGRLANPPQPMPVHLETFQILQSPTYASIRPPGQGLFLAAGQVLSGSPWVGVCFSVAAFCAGVCWMLQGWMPPAWALLGGVLAGLRLGVFTFWMDSYWGGAVAALGGVLALGALPRIQHRVRWRHTVLLACGIALLATTRPYEGLFVLLPVAGSLLLWLIRSYPLSRKNVIRQFVLPLGLLLTALAGWMAYYNWRITGHPTVSPYMAGRDRYNVAPPFLWQKPSPVPVYHHDVMREFFLEWELPTYESLQTPSGYASGMISRAKEFWKFYLRPAFTLPLLFLPWLIRDRRMRIPLLIGILTLLGTMVSTWGPPYYFAPVTAAMFLLVMQALQGLRNWRPGGRPAGLVFARAVPLASVGTFLVLVLVHVAGVRITGEGVFGWASSGSRLRERAYVLHQLENTEGQHLAIVRYPAGFSPHFDWVFNRADLDSAKVIWARDRGPEENEKLIRYFEHRRVWLVRPAILTDPIIPYPHHGEARVGRSHTPAGGSSSNP